MGLGIRCRHQGSVCLSLDLQLSLLSSWQGGVGGLPMLAVRALLQGSSEEDEWEPKYTQCSACQALCPDTQSGVGPEGQFS